MISDQKRVDVAGSKLFIFFMANKFTIAFLFCILGFIASEYFLLQEMFSDKRLPIIAGTIVGIVCSIVLFLVLYKKLLKITG